MRKISPAGRKGPPAADLAKLLAAASARHAQGDLPGAERGYRAILAQAPDHFDALHLLGVTRAQAKQAKEGVELISRALRIRPDAAEAHNNLGYALIALKRSAEAMECYRRALALKPDYLDAQRNLGNALLAANRGAEAVASFQKVIAARPGEADSHFKLGNALISLNRAAEAVDAYRRALALKPDYAEGQNNLGNALVALNQAVPALDAYRKALALKPGMAEAHNHLANTLQGLSRHEEAVASYEATLRTKPGFPYALGMIFHSSTHICDWRRHAEITRHLVDGIRAGKPVSMPLVLLAASDDPAAQLVCASAYSRERFPAAPPLWRGERYVHDRIRVAYLSADFREHPVALLIAELIEQHDRDRFELIGISFGPDAKVPMHERLKAAFDRFINVRNRSDAEIAALLRKAEVDIAVDLMGHTKHSRPGVFARRPAPVQLNYLGYPGTMGAGYIDYILADAFVIPAELRQHYSEKVVWLPDSFQVNDSQRRIAERIPTRAECGLPERGFVFCCFNNCFKINPDFFDVWMRLLANVEGSVLWLYAPSAAAAANLRREARARGVVPERLIFAPRAKLADYLARYRLADLFLDTLPYNAGTTASDALWAGLPVLTCAGRAFTGRMAGSLLRAVGLPELITHSIPDYEALALKLASHPTMLRELRDKLAANRPTAPLFDIERFRHHIESAYRMMWETYQRGEAPRAFSVAPGGLEVAEKIPPAGRKDASAAASNKSGNALRAVNRLAEAADAYRKAIAAKPDYAEAHNNLGITLADLSRHGDAIDAYRKALAIRPHYASALSHLGNSLQALGRYEAAVDSYEAALRINPDLPYLPGIIAQTSAYVCDWRRRDRFAKNLGEGIRAGKRVVTPFAFLALSDNPADQLACAATFARDRYRAAPALWRGERYRHRRIRVAYLSADFQDHATAVLMAELLERHDRKKFEIFGVSFGPDSKSAMRERLKAGFERFADVRGKSDAEVADLVRKSEIDIAIDLNGYTQQCRPGVFARRPAPIQVNYLGYPGTMGVDFIDYILADSFVIPPDQRQYYAEKVVCLPDSYQANDTKRRIAERGPTRAEAGLPERGFVFCCFNNSYKINAESFDRWMRLLGGVQGSVLWLLARDAVTAANLRREAGARGVDPGRLIFAPRVKPQDYLARYRLADLFLDTLPYNAHTTASDALWMGVPVLSRAGGTFAGRVAGSLLHAIGLPELVVQTGEDYERLALELATQPGRFAAIRAKLAANRRTAPLFDADRFRRHIEAAYGAMWELHQRGDPPRAFSVARAG
jgi:predicted O-linked N-acetylglucosamine transferase (SPINDLY family)